MTEYSLSDDDKKWLENLSRTGPGRQLEEHLKCVDYVIQNCNRFECPIEEACTFRRIFCHALAANDRVCGLPRPLPKYIAIVNLSGYRAILYSSRNSLIRMLCMVGPLHSDRNMLNVENVLKYASENDTSVLCCFSLPWQAGVHQVHWEVRTIERTGDCRVKDGVRSFSYTNEDVRVCASTIETDVCDVTQTKAQVVAMVRNFAACNLDISPDDIDVGDDASSDKFTRLKAVVAAVQADRARILSEMDAIRDDKKKSLEDAAHETDRRIKELCQNTQKVEATIRLKLKEVEDHNKLLLEQNLALGKAKAEAERAKAEFELLQEQKYNKIEAKAAMFEMSNKAASEKLTAMQKTHQRERDQLTKAHVKEVEDLERRISNETVSRRSAERKLETLKSEQSKLNDVCEKLRIEKQSISVESLRIRKLWLTFKCALAVAAQKHSLLKQKFQQTESCSLELKQMLEQSESTSHLTDSKIKQLEYQLSEANSRVEECNVEVSQARKKVVEIKKEFSEVKRQLAEARKRADDAEEAVESATAPTVALESQRECVSVEVNTEPQQEPEEVTKMRIEIAHLHDHKETLEKKLADALLNMQAASAQPTGNSDHCSQNGNNGSHNTHVNALQSYTDLSATPCGDPAIEALIGQLQLSMKNLVDLARSGHTHKNAAEQLWQEVQVLKRSASSENFQNGTVNVAWQGCPVYSEPPVAWYSVRR